MSEVQHITLVGDDNTSLKATFLRSGLPTVTLRCDRSGRVETFNPVVMEVGLSRREIRGLGEMMTQLADVLDTQHQEKEK